MRPPTDLRIDAGTRRAKRQAKAVEDVCTDTLRFRFRQSRRRRDRLAAPWNALPRKRESAIRLTGLLRCRARFSKNKRNRATESNIENILRVDLDGDGEDEVLISATKLFHA